jgi:hypothetical protein
VEIDEAAVRSGPCLLHRTHVVSPVIPACRQNTSTHSRVRHALSFPKELLVQAVSAHLAHCTVHSSVPPICTSRSSSIKYFVPILRRSSLFTLYTWSSQARPALTCHQPCTATVRLQRPLACSNLVATSPRHFHFREATVPLAKHL